VPEQKVPGTNLNHTALQNCPRHFFPSKQDLERGLQDINRQPTKYQEAQMRTLIDDVMGRDDKRTNEFLMRNVLYRAIDVHNELLKVSSDPKRDAFVRRFLKRSIEWAIELAGTDEDLLKQMDVQAFTKGTERAKFGLQWARMMAEMSFSLPTNDAHLEVLKMSMGYLYNDIVKDDNNGRHLAPIAAQFMRKKNQLDGQLAATPIQKLELVKDVRQLLMDETVHGLASVGSVLKVNAAEQNKKLDAEIVENSPPSENEPTCEGLPNGVRIRACIINSDSSVTFIAPEIIFKGNYFPVTAEDKLGDVCLAFGFKKFEDVDKIQGRSGSSRFVVECKVSI
jgi:hypothetical protein